MEMGEGSPQAESERGLSISDFEPCIGATLPITGGDTVTGLKLTRAEPLAQSPRKDGGFRLEFLGPLQPILAQSIYGFTIDGRQHDIFIVPLGPEADRGMLYEAIFF